MPHPHLDRRITIQSATETQDAHGQPVETWSDFLAELPAEYLPVSGAEQFQAQQVLARAVAKFRIRWRDDLTRKMRLTFESQTFGITHAEEDRRYDRHQFLIVTAELIPAS